MNADPIFAGLNPEQRRAVEATRGPVCVLAGAGSGKTTTITRRIANQVATGAFEATSILAVTFTDKAAGEMRARLRALGASGVGARTFHSAALAQLRNLAQEPPGQLLSSKVTALRQIANSLPKPYRFRPAADLATEVEWAKNRRLTPESYLGTLGAHEPPIPADLMQRVFARYERGKNERSLIDFEDLLELAIRMYTEDPFAVEQFQARYGAITVDEFQDVNLLQHSLLGCWLGERDDVCVVGDDYQSIYSFTGASPDYLIDFPARYPRATVVRLETNYRSTAQVLDVANRLAPFLGGVEKRLRPAQAEGAAVVARPYASEEDEVTALIEHVRSLHTNGIAFEAMAVLYRINFRSEDFEEALSRAHIPFQVRGGDFLTRPAARRVLAALRPPKASDVATRVRAIAEREGLMQNVPEGVGEQEATRQADLARLVTLAEEFSDGERTVRAFRADLEQRFSSDGEARGVNLITLHRSKGLEYEAVFLPRLQEGELPFKRSKTDAALAEERRLLYVGITRARRHLWLGWVVGGGAQPSRFLDELGLGAPAASEPEEATMSALKRWRLERARADSVPAYVVFHDATLEAIARRMPSTVGELAAVPGVGPAKLDRYGEGVLAVLSDGD